MFFHQDGSGSSSFAAHRQQLHQQQRPAPIITMSSSMVSLQSQHEVVAVSSAADGSSSSSVMDDILSAAGPSGGVAKLAGGVGQTNSQPQPDRSRGSEPAGSSSSSSSFLKQGWVLKEDLRKSAISKAWLKRFMAVDKSAKMLKFSTTAAGVAFPSQVESTLKLHAEMVCTAEKSWSNPDARLVEISDTKGLRLRIQVESEADQMEWISAIRSVWV